MATFTAIERFDRDALCKVLSNWNALPVSAETRRALDAAWTERSVERHPIDLVRSMLDASAPGSVGVAVSYRRGRGRARGRQYAIGPSLQSLPRSVRHTLAAGLYHDIDVENAQPTLVAHYCARHGVPAPVLQDYTSGTERREAMLRELGAPRAQAKRAIIALINGGRRACEELPRRPRWLGELAAEVERVHTHMIASEDHRDIVDAARRRRSGDGNLGGSVAAAVYAEMEDDVLMTMIHHLRSRGADVGGVVLVFDGFMLPADAARELGVYMADMLADLEAAVLDAVGVRVRLVEKPMDEAIDLSGLDIANVADVAWSAAPPPDLCSDDASVLIARPTQSPAWSQSRAYARVPITGICELLAAGRGADGAPPRLYEVLDPARAVRIFFHLAFPTAHAPAAAVVTQFLDAAVDPVVRGYFGVTADAGLGIPDLRAAAAIAVAANETCTTVRIALPVRAASLVDCFVVCARVNDRALAMRERYPALRMRTPGRTPMSTDVYEEGRALALVGAYEPATGKPLTAYAAPDGDSVHLVTAAGIELPEVCVHSPRGRVPPPMHHRRVSTRRPEPLFSATDVAEYGAFLNSWSAVPAVFGAPLELAGVSCADATALATAVPGTPCPFAACRSANEAQNGVGAARHEISLAVDDAARTARVSCSHPRCRGREITVSDAPVVRTDALDRVRTRTLHAQADGISWAERYCEPAMRPLPAPAAGGRALVCVRAQMGLGKTKAVVEYIRTTCDADASVLIVSYSVELCKRTNALLSEGTGMPFTLYRDTNGDIDDARVTVCLDSIQRCTRPSYDLVVLDEVQSVLAHFDSPHMRDSGFVSHKLEHLLTASRRVLFVDAVCDSTLVKLAVERLERARGERATWIRNDFVRPSNRTVAVRVADVATAATAAEGVRFAAMDETFRRLRASENVVHATNIRSHAVAMENAFVAQYPAEECAAYYGKGPRKLRDPAQEWADLRLLVYSPAITAGISYEGPRFDSLVAYFEIATHAPGVETIVQMLWRVRRLSTGQMTVYLRTPPGANGAANVQPHTAREVSAALMRGHVLTKKYLALHRVGFEALKVGAEGGDALFDRDRLSFDVLVGIVATKNRSLVNGLSLLVHTIAEDYGVPVTVRAHDYGNAGGGLDIDVAVESMRIDAAVPFDAIDHAFDDARASDVREQLREGGGDAVLAASLKMYLVRTEWRVALHRVDQAFYESFVAAADGARQLARLKRWARRCGDADASSAALRRQFAEYVTRTRERADPNLDIHKHTRAAHKMLIHAQELTEVVMTREENAALDAMEITVIVDAAHLEEAVAGVLDREYTPDELAELSRLFFSKPGRRDPLKWFVHVMAGAFGVAASRSSRDRTRRGYDRVKVTAEPIGDVVRKYEPGIFQPRGAESASTPLFSDSD